MTDTDAHEQMPVRRVERRAGRVLLFDRSGRILLFHGLDSPGPGAGSWWFTPGGGVEDGESMREAAERELTEETRLSGVELDGPVHERTADFEFEGVDLRQVESFFVARVGEVEIDTSGWTDLERRSMLECRWWSADELDSTSDTVFPEELAHLVRRLAP